MLGAISSALSGVNAGFDRLDNAADRIARTGADGDLAGNIVDLTKASYEVKLNVAVLRTADETIGSLINIFA